MNCNKDLSSGDTIFVSVVDQYFQETNADIFRGEKRDGKSTSLREVENLPVEQNANREQYSVLKDEGQCLKEHALITVRNGKKEFMAQEQGDYQDRDCSVIPEKVETHLVEMKVQIDKIETDDMILCNNKTLEIIGKTINNTENEATETNICENIAKETDHSLRIDERRLNTDINLHETNNKILCEMLGDNDTCKLIKQEESCKEYPVICETIFLQKLDDNELTMDLNSDMENFNNTSDTLIGEPVDTKSEVDMLQCQLVCVDSDFLCKFSDATSLRSSSSSLYKNIICNEQLNDFDIQMQQYNVILKTAHLEKIKYVKQRAMARAYEIKLLELENECKIELLNINQNLKLLEPLKVITEQWKSKNDKLTAYSYVQTSSKAEPDKIRPASSQFQLSHT